MERLKDVVLHPDQTPTAIWLLLLEHVRDRFEQVHIRLHLQTGTKADVGVKGLDKCVLSVSCFEEMTPITWLNVRTETTCHYHGGHYLMLQARHFMN